MSEIISQLQTKRFRLLNSDRKETAFLPLLTAIEKKSFDTDHREMLIEFIVDKYNSREIRLTAAARWHVWMELK